MDGAFRSILFFGPHALSGYRFRQDGDAFGLRHLSQVLIKSGKRKTKTHWELKIRRIITAQTVPSP
jgi:hypothetical protein